MRAHSGHAVFGAQLAARMLRLFSGGQDPPPGPPDDLAAVPELSVREQEVLALLAAEGLSNAESGRRLFSSPVTVRNHVSSILAKLQVTNRRQAMLRVRDADGPRRST